MNFQIIPECQHIKYSYFAFHSHKSPAQHDLGDPARPDAAAARSTSPPSLLEQERWPDIVPWSPTAKSCPDKAFTKQDKSNAGSNS